MSRTMRDDAMEHDQGAREALAGLVQIIDAAGLLNLSRGVQLGPTAWYCKASDRLDRARQVLDGKISDLELDGNGRGFR